MVDFETPCFSASERKDAPCSYSCRMTLQSVNDYLPAMNSKSAHAIMPTRNTTIAQTSNARRYGLMLLVSGNRCICPHHCLLQICDRKRFLSAFRTMLIDEYCQVQYALAYTCIAFCLIALWRMVRKTPYEFCIL